MANLNVRLFVLVMNMCVCVTVAFPYEFYNPYQAPAVRVLPIKPMNYTSVRRSIHKLPPINPLAEQVYVPKNLQQRYRPEQIMERLTSADTTSNAHGKNRKHKKKFNLMNFDAYMVKPLDYNYNKVLATLKPETDRILNILNRTDVQDDPSVSSSLHRSHHKSKSNKRPKPDSDPYFAQYELNDNGNYAQQSKRTHSKKPKHHKKPLNDELPIGFAYFDNDKNKNAFAPITYAPVAAHTISRTHKRRKHTSNIKNRNFQAHNGDEEPTTMQSIQNLVIQPKPNFINLPNFEEDPSTTGESFLPDKSNQKLHHVVPEMYKFTLDDVVVRPNRDNHTKKKGAKRPVTVSPFDELPSNIEIRTHHSDQPEAVATEKPPKHYYRHLRNNEHNSSKSYRKVERERPNYPAHYVSRQYRRVEAKSVTTTEYPLTETNGYDELQINPSIDEWLQPQKRNAKRFRNMPRRKLVPDDAIKLTPAQFAHESQQNLEVSPSYTKQRTQGINSAEDLSTTPMTSGPTKAGHFNKLHRTRQTHSDEETEATAQHQHAQPQNNQAKYYQDIFSEQLTPYNLDYGHLMENPSGWEERYERKNLKSHRHQGKVKWGNKKGGFGEHYYDLNHHLVGKSDTINITETR